MKLQFNSALYWSVDNELWEWDGKERKLVCIFEKDVSDLVVFGEHLYIALGDR